MKDTDGNRGWGWWVGITVFVFAAGVGGLNSYGQGLPPDVEDLLPHAVLLWQSEVLEGPSVGRELVVLAVEDMDGDGFPDIVFSQGGVLFSFVNTGSGGFEEASINSLHLVETYRERGPFRALNAIAVDLNNNGLSDLVVSGVLDETVGVLLVLENERGRFITRHERLLPTPAGWLGLADLSGDGRLDLLLSQWGEDSIGINFLQREDDFLFGDAVTVAEVSGGPFFLGDINGDGFTDLGVLHFNLAVWPDTGYVSFLWGSADGFRNTTTFSSAHGLARHATLFDLTGDGYLDLIVGTSRGVVVALYTEEGFNETGFYDPGFRMEAVYVADLDGDGKQDLLCHSVYGSRLAVLPGMGDGSFLGRASEYIPEFGFSETLHLADLNLDGLSDILLVDRGSIAVVMNSGVPQGVSRLPFSGSFLLGIADLDGNGTPDVLTQADTGIEVLWNNGRGGFVRARLAEMDSIPLAAVGTQGTLYALLQTQRRRHAPPPLHIESFTLNILQAYNTEGLLIGTWELGEGVLPALSIGDLDGDGRFEVVGSRIGSEAGMLWVLWGGEELREYPIPGRAALPVIADFTAADGDEIAIVCIAEYADLRIVSFSEREAQITSPLLQLLAQPVAIAAGDLDGDGLFDPMMAAFTVNVQREPTLIITAGRIVLAAHLSRYGPFEYTIPEFPTGAFPWMFSGLTIGDFTGDGLADAALSTVGGTDVFILPSNGDGTFGEAAVFPVAAGPLFAADLDGNGYADLVASTQGAEPYLWILWNGGDER